MVLSQGRARFPVVALRPVQAFDTFVGNSIGLIGLIPLMLARVGGLFDIRSSTASLTAWRKMFGALVGVSGSCNVSMQENLTFAFAVAAGMIVALSWFQPDDSHELNAAC